MELTFHGTDRTLTEEASVNQDGWIVTNGAMYPPIDHPNGRWQEVECSTFVPQEETTTDSTDDTDDTDSYSEPAELETTNTSATEEILNDSEKILEDFEPTGDPIISSEQNHAPVEQDLFAQMQMEMQALREENERLKQCNMIQTEATRRGQEPSVIEDGHRCSSPRVSPSPQN